jgi:DNA recombination protein RmuC
MDFTSQIGVLLLGFFFGAGVIAMIALYLYIKKLKKIQSPEVELSNLRNEMKLMNDALINLKTDQATRDGTINSKMEDFVRNSDLMRQEAQKLGNTLIRGGSAHQGQWVEMVLQNVLDKIGFNNPEDYETQKTYKDDEGKPRRLDVVIHLSRERDIIIDAKVALDHWEEYVNANNEDSKKIALDKHIKRVLTHTNDLSKKNYHKLIGINTVDTVFMFMPNEEMFQVIAEKSRKIIDEAFEKKIIPVGPISLFACLRIIENAWSHDAQSKRAEEIAKSFSEIYHLIANVYESFDNVSKKFEDAFEDIEEAKKRTKKVTRKLENYKVLGRFSPKKQLPNEAIEGED